MQNCSIHMYCQVFKLLFIDSAGVLQINLVNDLGEHGSQICVSYNLLGVVMFISHEMDLAGHFAARSSVIRAKTMFYSPTLNMDLTNLNAVCSIYCNVSILPTLRRAGYLGHYMKSDLVGPLKPDIQGFKYVCSLQDGFSRHIHLTPLKDKSAHSVPKALYDYGCMWGFPDVYHTDILGQNLINGL